MAGSLKKGYLGKEDIKIQTNTDTAETWERLSSVGGTQTITKFPDIWDGTGKVNAGLIEVNSVNPWMGFIRGFEVSRKDADEIYVSGGMIHINNGTNEKLCRSVAQVTHTITGSSTDTPLYMYASYPTSGSTLSSFSNSATPPTWNHTRRGWYYGALRFIGSIPVDDSGETISGYRSENGNLWMFDAPQNSTTITSGTWADITTIEDFVPAIDNALAVMQFKLDEPTVGGYQTRIIYVRKNGSASAGIQVCKAATHCIFYGILPNASYGNYSFRSFVDNAIGRFPVDVNGKLEWKTATLVTGSSWILGYWEPR